MSYFWKHGCHSIAEADFPPSIGMWLFHFCKLFLLNLSGSVWGYGNVGQVGVGSKGVLSYLMVMVDWWYKGEVTKDRLDEQRGSVWWLMLGVHNVGAVDGGHRWQGLGKGGFGGAKCAQCIGCNWGSYLSDTTRHHWVMWTGGVLALWFCYGHWCSVGGSGGIHWGGTWAAGSYVYLNSVCNAAW